ncbi:hypothetical protein SAMN06265222_10626 [Neorhodopirellula lusitana]|uniref:Uncharacterized protein n=1 Tax=Neorhodopirellula lusitana TaxID=445327 RepID=A0ABY1Q5N7_9BACT|nr:hypothetical protein SAMN06265222_10626 [Neorhodopirellula lusitana]
MVSRRDKNSYDKLSTSRDYSSLACYHTLFEDHYVATLPQFT